MAYLKDIYYRLLKAAVQGKTDDEILKIKFENDSLKELDCLLYPETHPIVWNFEECDCPDEKKKECTEHCEFGAVRSENNTINIDAEQCTGCGECIRFCDRKKLEASKDVIAVLNALKNKKGTAYALVAPAFIGQFSKDVTPGKLRKTFSMLGFDGMIEVALFADILTLKESLEFDKNIVKKTDYQLTSCCCPVWIAMIKKFYSELMPHVPGSVSPMIACGRTIKKLNNDALTVFIGPCLAKKAEAREKDLAGAIDYVLTFQEVADIFEACGIEPEKMTEKDKDHSSRSGRIYAYAGGVSTAVRETVERLSPVREITPHTRHASGVRECKEMLNSLLDGTNEANFYEGMGCAGGCVGGPKVLINRREGKLHVKEYAKEAVYPTPIDNPYVIELLQRLGFETVESLLNSSDIFVRNFD